MGTSKGYGGPASGLVPTWIDDGGHAADPARLDLGDAGGDGPESAAPGGADVEPADRPTAPRIPAPGGSLSTARNNFSRFAATGDRRALGRALKSYIRGGTGGASQATLRMGSSRKAGASLLGLVRDVSRIGAADTLRQRFDLGELAGRPASQVFVSLLEFVCPPGGAVDEAITRHAMLEAIEDLAEDGLATFESLTPDQLKEFFLAFVARSIEGRVIADIGKRGIALPDTVAAVERVQEQLHDFVSGCTQGELLRQLDGVEHFRERDLERITTSIYEAAFNLVAAAAEVVE